MHTFRCPVIYYFPVYPKANKHRTAWRSPCFQFTKTTSVIHPWCIFQACYIRLPLNHSAPTDITQLRTPHGMALAQFHRHTHTMPIDTVVSVTAVTQCVYVIHTWKKYTPRAQMTSVFEGQPLKTRPFLSKTRGPSWVPGIYIYSLR